MSRIGKQPVAVPAKLGNGIQIDVLR